MTPKEVISWSVHFETMEKHYRELVWESYEKSKRIATEGSLIGNEDTFAWNLCGINTKESGKFSFKMWIKIVIL